MHPHIAAEYKKLEDKKDHIADLYRQQLLKKLENKHFMSFGSTLACFAHKKIFLAQLQKLIDEDKANIVPAHTVQKKPYYKIIPGAKI